MPENQSHTNAEQEVQFAIQQMTDVETQTARSIERAASALDLPDDTAARRLRDSYDELLETQRELRKAMQRVKTAGQRLDEEAFGETPRDITDEHAERLRERYDDPVINLALALLAKNRREYLELKPETNGADAVERHGLTSSQRRWLDVAQEAIKEADADGDD